MYNVLNNENGFVLITAMVMLVVLTLLGTFALNTTDLELQISGNDKVAKDTFYHADGGTEAGVEAIERAYVEDMELEGKPGGFDNNDANTFYRIGGVDIAEADFLYNNAITKIAKSNGFVLTGASPLSVLGTDNVRSIRISDPTLPVNQGDTVRHVNIAFYSTPTGNPHVPGGGSEFGAGYQLGTSDANQGIKVDWNVVSRSYGVSNASSAILVGWRHVIEN